MLRLSKYYCSQYAYHKGIEPMENTASDDKTNMAEIVKRFFNNEPIPQMNEELQYQYQDSIQLDENGNPVLDSTGNIINVDSLSDENLDMIPIAKNLDEHERCCDSELQSYYNDATEKARAMVRGRQKELAEAQAIAQSEADNLAIKRAEALGYGLKTENSQSEKTE